MYLFGHKSNLEIIIASPARIYLWEVDNSAEFDRVELLLIEKTEISIKALGPGWY